ncbi:dof zinc finger protein DOF1.4-like [Salvia divinorum]|uniref:Dof zinc finger protein DOF1.4-like n=1 Tax=Salvia divinorum TaxID=28513 RepID=A0ABD1HUT4_SALDI
MVGNRDNKTISSSTTNQWPQNQIILNDQKSFTQIKQWPISQIQLLIPILSTALAAIPPTPNSATTTTTACLSLATSANPPKIDLPPQPSNHLRNPLFYGLNANPPELQFPFSSFRVSSNDSGFDQINGLRLGFTSKPIQVASSSLFSSAAHNSIPLGSSSFSTASTMTSLLHYEDPGMGKQAKAEGDDRLAWNPNQTLSLNTNPIDQINSFDHSSLVWNTSTSSVGAWFDPSTMGYSVPSLI